MDFVPVEAPAARMALSGKTLKFLNAPFRVFPPNNGLKVIANELIQAFSHRLRLLTGTVH